MTTEDEYFPYSITIEVPREATAAQVYAIFDAVADAAYEAQPEEREWDVFIRSTQARK